MSFDGTLSYRLIFIVFTHGSAIVLDAIDLHPGTVLDVDERPITVLVDKAFRLITAQGIPHRLLPVVDLMQPTHAGDGSQVHRSRSGAERRQKRSEQDRKCPSHTNFHFDSLS